MSGGTHNNINFAVRHDNVADAVMVVTKGGPSKEYPLTQADLYRLQDQVQECIILNIKRGREKTHLPKKRISDIQRGGI